MTAAAYIDGIERQRQADRERIEVMAESADSERETLWQPLPTDRFTVEELQSPPPPPRFVLAPYLPAGVPCLLQGAGGTSKTGLLVAAAVGLATGRPLFGSVPEPGSTLIVSAEDRRDTIRRHLHGATHHLPPDALDAVSRRIVVKDLVGLGFKLTRSAMGASIVDYGGLQALCEYAAKIPDLRLIAFDTLSRTHGGQESNEDLARYVEGLEYVCRELGVTTLVLHHTGKAQARAEVVDQYGGRGGSALSDNCRSVLQLSVPTPGSKDIPSNGVPLIAERRLLRLSHVKCNAAPLAADVWLERVPTDAAARLERFAAEHGRTDPAGVWAGIAEWMGQQTAFPHPTRDTIERECKAIASRKLLREALSYAGDAGLLLEVPHPEPKSNRRTYLRLAELPSADYGRARE